MQNVVIETLDRKGLRNFGLTFGAVVVFLFGLVLPWILSTGFPRWPWYLWLALAVWSVTAPMSLQPFYRGWMKFGLLMSRVTTPLIMAIVYYGVIAPTGLIARLFRDDPLQRNCREDRESFRIESTERPREHMENPF